MMARASRRFGTFSLAAHCPRTGQLGVATCTAALAVGAFVPHVRTGVGAVATQAFTNPYLGEPTLNSLAHGFVPDAVVAQVMADDEGRDLRQLLVVDAIGRSAAFTGSFTEPWAGHLAEANFAVAGNMLTGPEVVLAMANAFRDSADAPLAERLVRALEAGEAAGG